jgi:hypothetical protein
LKRSRVRQYHWTGHASDDVKMLGANPQFIGIDQCIPHTHASDETDDDSISTDLNCPPFSASLRYIEKEVTGLGGF